MNPNRGASKSAESMTGRRRKVTPGREPLAWPFVRNPCAPLPIDSATAATFGRRHSRETNHVDER